MAVTLPDESASEYARFSLYNSPYAAHDGGCAIDCYPGTLRDGRTEVAPSPVSGTVLETKTVRAPPKPYAPADDYLLLLECDGPGDLEGLVARVLHVDPTVSAGGRIERGDSLGRLVRAGFFAPWVDNHLHVGFRRPDQNPYRASGSLPIELESELRSLEWDGTGTVVATGKTYVVLDSPIHPAPGEYFVGVRADEGEILDGGLSHYEGGGVLGRSGVGETVVSLNGDRLGVADGRTIAWDDVVVTANGDPITGLSLFCARDGDFGAKLICPDREFEVGEHVKVRVRSSDAVGR
ncbi:hypothetical protein [Natronobacterium gregoryi]|uniref:Uncharacterized protein n=2 Tax=Natronobacterium gregoryi TaxID=44930 RepID=L0AGF4_NATGS|nr:hypothetical protein [Natronobacterium gregoryi]AFZ72499.1 hypothetical protein Natgr_1276 [Natronobacterium gregoryi SP2]ELY74371.1 hypothetical protein C490_00340 [Natronobacterium gregoryi SP2]PLK21470.1 hypothetical protein CYV19_04010 [Natronobacterium gregoryi SP2]SFI77086.1 hypothetical protein SAMN05443661_10567 [Natronobacterium gregoryi]